MNTNIIKALFLLAALLGMTAISGCTSVGNGIAYGYVVAVGDEFGTPTAYIAKSLGQSQEDLYCASKGVRSQLEEFAATGERVKVTYETSMCAGVNADCDTNGDDSLFGSKKECKVEGRIIAVEAAPLPNRST